MAQFEAAVTWIDARERLPRQGGRPVAVAVTGHYPPKTRAESERGVGQPYWLVRPMVFATVHTCGAGVVHHDCFFDSDGYTYGPTADDGTEPHDCATHPGEPGTAGPFLPDDEFVTHWAELPALPGGTAHALVGEAVLPALREARGTGPTT
ncbi:AQJ64_40280 family protein [Streptomyces sp. NPDC002067]